MPAYLAEGLGRLARAAALGVFGLAVGWAGVAEASLSDNLCNPFAEASLGSYPSGDALRKSTSEMEGRLARRGPSDPFQELKSELDPPSTGAQAPPPQALADYCAAAGELMRESPQGSQQQAQYYLLSAFQIARGAGLG